MITAKNTSFAGGAFLISRWCVYGRGGVHSWRLALEERGAFSKETCFSPPRGGAFSKET